MFQFKILSQLCHFLIGWFDHQVASEDSKDNKTVPTPKYNSLPTIVLATLLGLNNHSQLITQNK